MDAMEPARGMAAPISFFAHASLAAGWYIGWRLAVFTAPFWLIPGALAAGLLHVVGAADTAAQPELLLAAAMLVVVGLIAAFVASISMTSRIASGWSRKRWGRPVARGVWWGIFWRVAVIGAITGVVTGAAQAAFSVYAAVTPWSPEVLFVTLIPYAVMLGSLVVTLRAYGWAMSTMVAKRLNAEVSAPGGPDAGASAPVPRVTSAGAPAPATRVAGAAGAPRSVAPAAAERLQCPKCGLREIERGQVIGWHCTVCGWRERR